MTPNDPRDAAVSRRDLDAVVARFEEIVRRLEALRAADAEAVRLARANQLARDQQADALRAQIESERGLYMTVAEFTRQHEALEDKVASIGHQVAVTAAGLLVSLTLVLIATIVNLAVRITTG